MSQRPPLLSPDPAIAYNVLVDSPVKGHPPHQPLRSLVANMRWIYVQPWLKETSLEDVVLLWQYVRRGDGEGTP